VEIAEIKRELQRLDSVYRKWHEPVRNFSGERLKRVMKRTYPAEQWKRDVAEFIAERRKHDDGLSAVEAFIDEVSDAYSRMNESEQADLRMAVAPLIGIAECLLDYMRSCAVRLRDSANPEWLRKGLAAACLEDLGEYRDSLLALAELYVVAEQVGIDPRAEFELAARHANTKGGRSIKSPLGPILRDFHQHPVVPERRKRGRPYW
jgi:hypothetical protein